MKNELILFETADKEIKLNVSVKDSTVWLNRNQLAELKNSYRNFINEEV